LLYHALDAELVLVPENFVAVVEAQIQMNILEFGPQFHVVFTIGPPGPGIADVRLDGIVVFGPQPVIGQIAELVELAIVVPVIVAQHTDEMHEAMAVDRLLPEPLLPAVAWIVHEIEEEKVAAAGAVLSVGGDVPPLIGFLAHPRMRLPLLARGPDCWIADVERQRRKSWHERCPACSDNATIALRYLNKPVKDALDLTLVRA
jgi:hypothetical protein|tara:strand:- start:7161 stop:7769 length:609 start_codon:yes stop_codon:yes gene_type:complete